MKDKSGSEPLLLTNFFQQFTLQSHLIVANYMTIFLMAE